MIPRGIRNNNPLNIRVGNKWEGEVDVQTDRDFEQFTSMLYGVRAGFVLLRRYIERYHIDTIQDIVSRWAPASENKTACYVRCVAERVGINELQRISFYDKRTMVRLVDAMILQECGTTIGNATIEQAYDLVNR